MLLPEREKRTDDRLVSKKYNYLRQVWLQLQEGSATTDVCKLQEIRFLASSDHI
ncbi:MAG: hypothetical protein LN563_06865 [Rickettsia endosymbiont of Platyusa sonomae]|nr:hypothetical protein [Rickettsia endosymbiont of Platyusa sonomae]